MKSKCRGQKLETRVKDSEKIKVLVKLITFFVVCQDTTVATTCFTKDLLPYTYCQIRSGNNKVLDRYLTNNENHTEICSFRKKHEDL